MQSHIEYQLGSWRLNIHQSTLSRQQDKQRLDNKVLELLVFLIQHKGEVITRQQILDEVWQDVVVADDVLNVTISSLRKHLGDDSKHPEYIKTIPRKGYQLICQVDVLSGARLEERFSPDSKAKPLGILVFFLLFVSSFVFYSIIDRPPPNVASVPTNIAVLPFDFLAADPKDNYIANGLTEAIINRLVQTPGLQVTSRTSVMTLQDENLSVREIAQRLNVDWILEGAVQLEGNTLSITAQLINAESDKHIWSESYARDRHDLFAIQLDIASQIARKFGSASPSFSRAKKVPTDAYEVYLHARFLQANGQLIHADERYQEAINLYPDYVEALTARALLAFYQGFGAGESSGQFIEQGSELTLKAHKYQQGSANLSLALALHYFYTERDLLRAGEYFRQAYSQNDQDIMLQEWYLNYLIASKNFVLAEQVVKQMMSVSPLAYNKLAQFDIYYYQRRFDDAIQELEKKRPLIGNDAYIDSLIVHVLIASEDTDALSARLSSMSHWQNLHAEQRLQIQSALSVGNLPEALKVVITTHQDKLGLFQLAGLYAQAKESEKAMSLLRKLVNQKRMQTMKLAVEPAFDNLRHLPEFSDMIRF